MPISISTCDTTAGQSPADLLMVTDFILQATEKKQFNQQTRMKHIHSQVDALTDLVQESE